MTSRIKKSCSDAHISRLRTGVAGAATFWTLQTRAWPTRHQGFPRRPSSRLGKCSVEDVTSFLFTLLQTKHCTSLALTFLCSYLTDLRAAFVPLPPYLNSLYSPIAILLLLPGLNRAICPRPMTNMTKHHPHPRSTSPHPVQLTRLARQRTGQPLHNQTTMFCQHPNQVAIS